MEKNPKTCKNSIRFHGTCFCSLELLPCAMVEKCALQKLDDMARIAAEYLNHRKENPRVEEAEDDEEVEEDEEVVEDEDDDD